MLLAAGGDPTEPPCSPLETHCLSLLHAAPISNLLPLHPYWQHWELLLFPPPSTPEIPQPPALTLAAGEGTRCWLQPPSSSSPAAEHRLLLLLWCGCPGWGPAQPSPAPAPPLSAHTRLRAQPYTLPSQSLVLRQSSFWGVRAWDAEPAAPCPGNETRTLGWDCPPTQHSQNHGAGPHPGGT